jgi:adenosylhomocysteine nucleosidase
MKHFLLGCLLCGLWSAEASARTVLVIAPLREEFQAATSTLSGAHRVEFTGRSAVGGRAGNTEVIVVRSGWGKAHAAAATAEGIERYHPQLVLLAGIAGALEGRGLEPGDVVVAGKAFDRDVGKLSERGFEPWSIESPAEENWPAEFAADAAATNRIARAALGAQFVPWKYAPDACPVDPAEPPGPKPALQPGPIGRATPRICAGTIATGDVFVATSSGLAALKQRGADAVDMEASAIAEEAKVAGVPFAAVRVVSDVAGVPGSDFLYYCLKKQAAARLSAVLSRALPALSAIQNIMVKPVETCDAAPAGAR